MSSDKKMRDVHIENFILSLLSAKQLILITFGRKQLPICKNVTARVPAGRIIISPLLSFRIACDVYGIFFRGWVYPNICSSPEVVYLYNCEVDDVWVSSMRSSRIVRAPAPWIIQWDDLPILGKESRPMVNSRVVPRRFNCSFANRLRFPPKIPRRNELASLIAYQIF